MAERSRLWLVLLSVAAMTSAASATFAATLAAHGFGLLDFVLTASFAVLFAWVSFWCLCAGVGYARLRRRRRSHESSAAAVRASPPTDLPACAVLIPVHNENAEHVFARIRAMLESLTATGLGDSFELFVLSDTSDPDVWLREELAWAELRQSFYSGPRLWYRRRAHAFRTKSGNIADFCERWGNRYRYMVVLDADCVLDGETMVELVRRMERAPEVGILQTPTIPAMRHSLYARREQFAAALYGPPLFAGLAQCFQGSANFWGHNAIIRVRPFVLHCGLPALPGSPPLGGPILSHDFVEAALMRRAGYEVRLADDLQCGSYEQSPASLASAVARDRRWCQGNLQHLRFLLGRSFSLRTRVHFASGVMSYAVSGVWGIFLCTYGIQYLLRRNEPSFVTAFAARDSVLLGLLAASFMLLLLGKALGLAWVVTRGGAGAYGGARRLMASVLLETLIGVATAPVLMVHHSVALVSIALGSSTQWNSASREETGTPLRDAWRAHGAVSLVFALIGAALSIAAPALSLRLSPVWLSLALAVPLAAALSSSKVGAALRARGLLLSPAEAHPPVILARIAALLPRHDPKRTGFVDRLERLIRDPWLNGLHVGLLRSTGRKLRPRSVIAALIARVAEHGAANLDRKEKLALLSDTWAMRTLHEAHVCRDEWTLERGLAPRAREAE